MFNFESNEIVMIPIDKIDLPETPLRLFEPRSREEIERLAESVGENGIVHPIIVLRKGESGRFEIIGGEGRFRASVLAGMTEVPCRIVQSSGEEAEASLLALMDNLARKDMHPLDIADALRRQVKHVENHKQVYRALGWTEPRFSQILRLSDLPEEVRQILRDRKDGGDGDWRPTERHFRAINQLTGYDQVREKQIEITTRMLEHRWNVARTEAEVKQVIDQSTKGKKKRKSRHVVVPGLPEGAIAKVAPGKLHLEVSLDSTGSWSETWEGITAVLGGKDFDPRAFLHNESEPRTFPKSSGKRKPKKLRSENFPVPKPLLLPEGNKPFLSKSRKRGGGKIHEKRNQSGNQANDAIGRRRDSQA